MTADYSELRAAAALKPGRLSAMMLAALDELDALRKKVKPPKTKDYPPDFLRAWEQYPARPGSSKAATFKAWTARMNAGASALEMMHGARQYAAYVLALSTEPEYIKTAQVFFGPGEHFASDWTIPAPKASSQWRSIESAAIAKAAEVGITPLPGEGIATLRGRIQARLDGIEPQREMSRVTTIIQDEPKRFRPDGPRLASLIKQREAP